MSDGWEMMDTARPYWYADSFRRVKGQPSTPLLQLESLNFFEMGKDTPKRDQRSFIAILSESFMPKKKQPKEEHLYSTHFSKDTTRYITYKLVVKNLQRLRDQTYQIEHRYYSPDRSLMVSKQY